MLTTFGIFAPTELIIVLVVVLIIFGPGKLPDIGKALGKGISEFKSASGQETVRPAANSSNAEQASANKDRA